MLGTQHALLFLVISNRTCASEEAANKPIGEQIDCTLQF